MSRQVTVGQLIELLQHFDPAAFVFVQVDADTWYNGPLGRGAGTRNGEVWLTTGNCEDLEEIEGVERIDCT